MFDTSGTKTGRKYCVSLSAGRMPGFKELAVSGAADLTGRQVGRRRESDEPADRPVPS
jgi:hypothetical protein